MADTKSRLRHGQRAGKAPSHSQGRVCSGHSVVLRRALPAHLSTDSPKVHREAPAGDCEHVFTTSSMKSCKAQGGTRSDSSMSARRRGLPPNCTHAQKQPHPRHTCSVAATVELEHRNAMAVDDEQALDSSVCISVATRWASLYPTLGPALPDHAPDLHEEQ
jgi:hypothetical protein